MKMSVFYLIWDRVLIHSTVKMEKPVHCSVFAKGMDCIQVWIRCHWRSDHTESLILLQMDVLDPSVGKMLKSDGLKGSVFVFTIFGLLNSLLQIRTDWLACWISKYVVPGLGTQLSVGWGRGLEGEKKQSRIIHLVLHNAW